ncbi:unnamed protein product [marine sediment metagenome]|uniref:Cell envelope-related transcriptional attenuator domain-containing protein n=1 Tax=marine sediment metagenome TaxID=412755 RepID=X1QTS2_9ZZZZ
MEIDVEKEMHYVDKAGGVEINLYPGMQILNGEKSLQYIRFRHDKLSYPKETFEMHRYYVLLLLLK